MIKRIIPYAVLALCIYLLWHSVDWHEAASLLRTAQLWIIGCAVLVLTIQTGLSAERWRITAAQLGIAFPFRHALREYYLSQVVNQSLPGGVLGDAGRAIRTRDQAGLTTSLQAVIFERLAGQLGLIAVLGSGGLAAMILPGRLNWPDWVAPGSAALAGSIGLGVAAFTIMRVSARLSAPICRALANFTHAIFGRAVWARQLGLSLGTALCNITAFGLCAFAVGSPLGFLSSIILIPIILFAMTLPLSVGGWGLREGVAALLFPVAGLSSAEGLATSIAFGIALLISVIPGLVIGWAAHKSTPFRRHKRFATRRQIFRK